MNRANLETAIYEARRFLQKAVALHKKVPHEGQYYYPSKESSAARRASMDLTRALAELRKPL